MKKKLVSLLLTSFLLFGLTGCGGGQVNIEVPEYESDRVYEFMAYIPPPNANWDGFAKNPNFITDEQYGLMEEAGFTKAIALYEGCLPGGGTIEEMSEKAQKDAMAALEQAEKHNIKYYVRDWTFYGAVHQNQIPMEEMRSTLEKMFDESNTYIHEPAYFGNFGDDEPPATDFDDIKTMIDIYHELVPDGEFLINLLPTYSSSAQLGCSSYEEYIDLFIEKIGGDYIMFDHYPLIYSPEGTQVREDYVYNLGIVASKARDADMEMRGFIQCHSYGSMIPDITGISDLRFQAYINMAFGMSEMAYYTYFSSLESSFTGGEALIDREGNPTFRYEAAKTLNNEIHNFENVYFNFDWKNVMTFNGNPMYPNTGFSMLEEKNYSIKEHDAIARVEVSEDTILGCFEDGEGRDGFMLVNYANPTLKDKTNRVTIQFNNAHALLMYRYGQRMLVPLNEDGSYEFVLSPGDGRFIVPLA